jgi:hypothetical protein
MVALVSTIDDVVEMSGHAITELRRSAILHRSAGLPEHAALNERVANELEYTIGLLTAAPPADTGLPRTSFLAALRVPSNVPTLATVGWMVRRLVLGRGVVLRILPLVEIYCMGAELIALKAWIESLDSGPSGKSGEWPTTG